MPATAGGDRKTADNRRPCEETLRGKSRPSARIFGNFGEKEGFDEVLVVNLASTEPRSNLGHATTIRPHWKSTRPKRQGKVRASTYTPMPQSLKLSLHQFLPRQTPPWSRQSCDWRTKGRAVMGNEGRPGRPSSNRPGAMFAYRNLEVMSWSGFNILGNLDGQVHNNPGNKESKIRTKDQVLSKVLGYSPHSTWASTTCRRSTIRNTWDFIHFRDFSGEDVAQFVWQGYDSILAAPLVLDMIRLAELAKRREKPASCRIWHLFSKRR